MLRKAAEHRAAGRLEAKEDKRKRRSVKKRKSTEGGQEVETKKRQIEKEKTERDMMIHLRKQPTPKRIKMRIKLIDLKTLMLKSRRYSLTRRAEALESRAKETCCILGE